MVWRPVNRTSDNVLSLGLYNFNKQRFRDVWQRKIKIASKFKIQIARNIQTISTTGSIFATFPISLSVYKSDFIGVIFFLFKYTSPNETYKINYDKFGKLIIPALFATDQIPTYRPLSRSQIFGRWNLEKKVS